MAQVLDSHGGSGTAGNQDNREATSRPFNSVSMVVAQKDEDPSGVVSASDEDAKFIQGYVSFGSSSISLHKKTMSLSGSDEFESTMAENQEGVVLAFSSEETRNSFTSCNEKIAMCELGLASPAFDGKGEDFSKEEQNVSGIEESGEHHGKASEDKFMEQVQVEKEDSELENVLDSKKKRLLEVIEAVLLPKDEVAGKKTSGCHEGGKLMHGLPTLELIDETALIEIIRFPGTREKTNGTESMKKNGKRSRRRAKWGNKVLWMDGNHKILNEMTDDRIIVLKKMGMEPKKCTQERKWSL